ncbi:MAG: molybdopterin molybdotransferase MoeA [Rhizobiales bacterium]|nr:molybdopterin molybdotransferase MoeA [Hyphomicrobiales bacterium]
MAQLSDDCFAFSGPLMPVEEAERLIVERVSPVAESEDVRLSEARGRVLAADIVAPISLPPFANSAVDGYAVRHADLAREGDTRLPIMGRAAAGHAAGTGYSGGAAIRIFTGAPMPDGADTVFMQEDCRVEDGVVVLPHGLKVGANRRLAGEDVRAGSVALAEGTRLKPAQLALAAALGIDTVHVRRRLRVALFSTGDEVAEPGTPLTEARIYDANRRLLSELLIAAGADVTDLGILKDTPDSVATALAAAAGHDLIVTSGGVSTGEADHVRDAVERIGRLVFWRIALKPGRPVAMGVVGGAAFVGLPGNPVAAFVTFVRVVRPLLARLSGAKLEPLVALPVRAAFSYKKKKGRREYVRVSLSHADGVVSAQKFPREGAGVLSSLTETDGLAELPEDVTKVAPGDTIGFLPYAVLMG